MRTWSLLLPACLLTVAVPARAQVDDSLPFVKAALAALDSLALDSAIQARVGQRSGAELFSLARPDALARLSDAELLDFDHVLVTTLSHADTVACADLWRKGFQGAFEVLVAGIDSTDAVGWGRWVANMVRASVLERPVGPMAGPDEVSRVIWDVVRRRVSEDTASVLPIVQKRGGAAATCRFIEAVFSGMLELPPARAAVVFRGSMFGS